MSIEGKVAVVTGAASGIGRAIALRLASEGARVAVWDLDRVGAEATAAALNTPGLACEVDAASAHGIEAAVSATRSALGHVSILVNNAAITAMTAFVDLGEEEWDRMIRINLKGPFLCTKAVLPDMLKARWGRIVNISSSSFQLGVPRMTHYVASKGGLIGFTRSLAMEVASEGITVNTIPPGYVDTPMLRATARNFEGSVAASPMKRAGRPEDIAAACAYLVSEEANYVTGQTLSVNGGRFLN